jgi:multidrug resistance efflux pump
VGRRPGPAGGVAEDAGSTGSYASASAGATPPEAIPPEPIPTPWRIKWDRFAHGLLPVIVFLIALAFMIYLWRRHTGFASVVGEVDARHVTIASTSAGTLTEPGKKKISKYERVQEGDVIARLEVGGELQHRQSLRQDLEQLRQALAGATGNTPATAPAAAAAPTTGPAASPVEASLRAAIASAERELERIESTIQSSEIRAPITGRVTHVHIHPGQSVLPGQAIMEIVEEQGSHIIAFVRQESGFRPTAGMPVEVHPRSSHQHPYGSHVETVGARIESVPDHQLMDPKRPEWGLPVRIALPAASGLKPGELVGLVFKAAK